jgi:hypothetical protein
MNMHIFQRTAIFFSGCFLLLIAHAQTTPTKSPAAEDQVRQAAFHFYFGMVFGDPDECNRAVGTPLYSIHDGQTAKLDDQAVKEILKKSADTIQNAHLSADEKKGLAQSIVNTIDQAEVQFNGANTANITFISSRTDKGDSCSTLILYRKDKVWRVISEITDSSPIPSNYIIDLTKPTKNK